MGARPGGPATELAPARSACDLDRPGRPDRSRADPAGEDVTELDSIPAGRIDQEGPYCITDFRAVPFRPRRPIPGDRSARPPRPPGGWTRLLVPASAATRIPTASHARSATLTRVNRLPVQVS